MGNNCCTISTPQSRTPQFASCPRYSAVNQSPIIGRIIAPGGLDDQVTQKQPETKWSNGGLYQAVTGGSQGAIHDKNALPKTINNHLESQASQTSVDGQYCDIDDDRQLQERLVQTSESKESAKQTLKGEVVLDRVSRSQQELDNPKVSCPTSGGSGQSKSLSSLRRLEGKEISVNPRHNSASVLSAGPSPSIKADKVEETVAMFSSARSSEEGAIQLLEKGSKNSALLNPIRNFEAQTITPVTNPSKEICRNSSSLSSCLKDSPSLLCAATSRTSSAKRVSAQLSHRLSAALESGTDSAAIESGAESCALECSTNSGRQSPVTFESRASFRLVRDLEVPDPDVVQSKDLKQLMEAFVRDNSLMRKPCKEFLDRASYRRAKLEHHLSLVSTVKGVDVCSLSCTSVSSSRTVNEQSTLELQGTPPKSVCRLSAKKNLNFEKMCCSTGRPTSDSTSDSTRIELFNLEDFLETASEDQKYSDVERSLNLEDASLVVGVNSRPHVLDESFGSSGFKNSSPRKSSNSPRNSVPLPRSKEWETDQDYGNDEEGLKKRDSLAKEGNTIYKEPSYVNGWDDPVDLRSDGCGVGKEDKENSPPIALNALQFKKPTANFQDSFDGGNNETPFRSGRRSRSSVSSLKESSPLSKINTLNLIDNFPSFECEDQYGSNKERAYSTPKKKKSDISAFESLSRDGLDDKFSVFNSCLNSSKFSDDSYKTKCNLKNDSFSNKIADGDTFSKPDTYNGFNSELDAAKSDDGDWPKLRGSNENFKSGYGNVVESADPDPLCSELPLFGEEDRDSTSRLNVSSSSQRSLRRPSPAFGRPFATLSGISPTYKKRNSFKFDEDPRFGCNTSQNNDSYHSDYGMQDNLGIGRKSESGRCSPVRGKRSRRVHAANDSQDFDNENLFAFSEDDDEILEDPFSTSAHQNASMEHASKGDGEDQQEHEGPSIRLNKHIKISKKGITLGAMGCELSIGKNVELNIFGKKTATLV